MKYVYNDSKLRAGTKRRKRTSVLYGRMSRIPKGSKYCAMVKVRLDYHMPSDPIDVTEEYYND